MKSIMGSSFLKRKRNTSCLNCRRAHSKCVGDRPCERCISHGLERTCSELADQEEIRISKYFSDGTHILPLGETESLSTWWAREVHNDREEIVMRYTTESFLLFIGDRNRREREREGEDESEKENKEETPPESLQLEGERNFARYSTKDLFQIKDRERVDEILSLLWLGFPPPSETLSLSVKTTKYISTETENIEEQEVWKTVNCTFYTERKLKPSERLIRITFVDPEREKERLSAVLKEKKKRKTSSSSSSSSSSSEEEKERETTHKECQVVESQRKRISIEFLLN